MKFQNTSSRIRQLKYKFTGIISNIYSLAKFALYDIRKTMFYNNKTKREQKILVSLLLIAYFVSWYQHFPARYFFHKFIKTLNLYQDPMLSNTQFYDLNNGI